MQRREALRILGQLAVLPAFSRLPLDRLEALGREIHQRLSDPPVLRLLDPHQHELVAVAAELIIPGTDTPGARAARVADFIDLIVAEWYTPEEQKRFLDGLADLDRRGQARLGRVFLDMGPADQERTLSELEAEWLAFRVSAAKPEEHFYHQIKFLTIYGYYTSKVGVEQELRWTPVPGRYDPCLATGVRRKGSR
jgi:hypothetical protein